MATASMFPSCFIMIVLYDPIFATCAFICLISVSKRMARSLLLARLAARASFSTHGGLFPDLLLEGLHFHVVFVDFAVEVVLPLGQLEL